ncbi:hypothetical protein BCV69DRAFT_282115 [Microstroma glucosiphilum]|uniref:Integral membrane protein n=1 Tax=Pseudomicrostroma glucosiphilum TaxID=1684307 RepID=A0A316U822_9BASI|nr:hypothetical protein BCV69DRAFT_282115 [Pseudomicrostroma glucosiphilum]PWN21390.1 hypothetical protein BCV69DRAFT_282115 [Pseudomicrostroma glucosiphilum]
MSAVKLPTQNALPVPPGAGLNSPASSTLTSNPLLSRYLVALQANPLRTKQITSGVLSALAEVLAGHFAGLPSAAANSKERQHQADQGGILGLTSALLAKAGINDRAGKMFIYGSLVSAPLGHVLTGMLQRAFVGKTSPRDKVMQIIVSSLTVTVITNIVYLASMAVVNGARAPEKIMAVVKAGIWKMLQISWATSPLAIAFAQNYLPPELWEPFFTVIRFFLSTAFNTMAKKKQVALARKEALRRGGNGGGTSGSASGNGGEKDLGDADIRSKAAGGSR